MFDSMFFSELEFTVYLTIYHVGLPVLGTTDLTGFSLAQLVPSKNNGLTTKHSHDPESAPKKTAARSVSEDPSCGRGARVASP